MIYPKHQDIGVKLSIVSSILLIMLSSAAAQVSVYEDCNYGGYQVPLPAGDHRLHKLIQSGMKNDDISSIRISPGYSVTIYEHDNYKGKSKTFTANTSCLIHHRFNDMGSSIKVSSTGERSSWLPPSGDFPLFDECSKSGDTFSTDSTPKGWLISATKNWMARLPDSTSLSHISIPGTHDSGARYGGAACETQVWTITEQLNAGLRYLDIRVRRTGTSFAIHHSVCFQKLMFDDVMDQVQAFLNAHPGEVILMRVKEDYGPQNGSESFKNIWNRYMNRFGNLFVGSLSNIPTLGQVRGKVFVLRDTGFKDTSYGMSYGNNKIERQDDYKVFWVFHDNPFGADTVSLPQKKERIAQYIDKAKTGSELTLNHLSGAIGMTPGDVAEATHAAAYEKIGPYKSKKKLGVLIMDYPGDKMIYRTIKTNFTSSATCRARTWRTVSDETWAEFRMPRSTAGTVHTIKGGGYYKYVFPKCNRVTWTDLRFSCGLNGKWTFKGSWDADAGCIDSNTNQTYLYVGER